MKSEEQSFIDQLKRHILIYAVVGMFTIIGTAVGFYYNTQSSIKNILDNQEKFAQRQILIENELSKLNDRKIDKEIYLREVDEVKKYLLMLSVKIDNLHNYHPSE